MQTWRTRLPQLWPGWMVTFVVAIAALFLSNHYGAPVMLFALLLGMAVNFLSEDRRCQVGIEFAAKTVLRWGVALLGLKITASQVQALGWQPAVMVVVAVASSIGFGIAMARLMGFKSFFGLLSGGAVGICGASAAMAIAAAFPHHPQRDRATLFTVICVSTLSTVAMVTYPMLVRWLDLDPLNAGLFLGGTVHDVAQVVGAGYSMGHATGDTATVVKLMRVAMLVPALGLATWMTHRLHRQSWASPSQASNSAALGENTTRPPLLPGFAIVFAGLVVVNSVDVLPAWMVEGGNELSRAFLVAAMAAIGMKTHLKDILGVGWKPVALVVLETLFLAGLFLGLMKVFALHG